MKILKTQKLFYGKWAYKVSVQFRGAHLIRFYGAEVLIRRFEDPKDSFRYHSFKEEELIELERFARLIHKLQDVTNIKYRYESNTINIFTDTADMYDKIKGMFFSNIKKVWEPADLSEAEYLKDNVNNVVVDFLPYNKYRYKVILKYNAPRSTKESIISWLSNNTHSSRASVATVGFLHSRRYTASPFIYVEDDKTLIFLQLIAGNQINKTEKYIIRTDINNTK